jgi:putative salt-induced outer membrane protein YdiY
MKQAKKVLLAIVALGAAPAPASAQTPEGTLKDEKATTGATDVTTNKAAIGDRANMKEAKDATELSVSAGTLTTSGNARLVALTASSKFRLRRGEDQVSAAAAANYARAAASPADEVTTTVENVQGLGRYDRFLGDVTLFGQVQARRDRFQGLDLRLNFDPGVGYYFINEQDTLLWVEVGYDLLHDIRRDGSLDQFDEAGNLTGRLDKTQTVHSARGFVGYEFALDTGFKLSAGLEYLQGLASSNKRAGQTATEIYRINGVTAATAKVFGNLSISLAFTGRYDHGALPGKERLDTITSANLVYTLL